MNISTKLTAMRILELVAATGAGIAIGDGAPGILAWCVFASLLALAGALSLAGDKMEAPPPRREVQAPQPRRPRPEALPKLLRTRHDELDQIVSAAESAMARLRTAAAGLFDGAAETQAQFEAADRERTELRGTVRKISLTGNMIAQHLGDLSPAYRQVAVLPEPAPKIEAPTERDFAGALERELLASPSPADVDPRVKGAAEDLDAMLAKPAPL